MSVKHQRPNILHNRFIHSYTHTLVVTVTDACLMQTHTVPHALLSCSVPLAAAAGGAARGRPSSPCGRVGWRGGQTGQTHTLLPGRYQPGTGRGYSGKQAWATTIVSNMTSESISLKMVVLKWWMLIGLWLDVSYHAIKIGDFLFCLPPKLEMSKLNSNWIKLICALLVILTPRHWRHTT